MNEQGSSVFMSTLEKKDYKLLKKITPPKHMVSVLQAQPLLLLSTGTVVLSPFSCPSVGDDTSLQILPGATVPPTAQEEGVSLFPPFFSPSPASSDMKS